MYSQIMHDTAYGINAKCQTASSLHRQMAFLFRASFSRTTEDAARERETGERKRKLGLVPEQMMPDKPKYAEQERLAEAFAASQVLCYLLSGTLDPETGKTHEWIESRKKRGESNRQAFYMFDDLIQEQAEFFVSRKITQIRANAALLKKDPKDGVAAALADAKQFLKGITDTARQFVEKNEERYAKEGEQACIDCIEEVIVEAGMDPDTVCREACQGIIKWQGEANRWATSKVDVGIWAIANGLSPVAAAAKGAELKPAVDPVPATS